MSATTRYHAPEPVPPPNLRDARAVADLFAGVFRRDLQAFFPQCRFEPVDPSAPVTLTRQPVPAIRLDLLELFDPKELGKYLTPAELAVLDDGPAAPGPDRPEEDHA